MNKITLNNTVIELYIGDLIQTEYDAIVIPSNSRLLPSGELRCKVIREAGPKVQVECNVIAQKISSIPVGSAVITSGGNLKSRFIIHTRAGHDGKKLVLATWNSLKTADKHNINSLVYPPLSKDVIGFSAEKSAQLMLPTIKKYLIEKNSNIKNISISLGTLPDYKAFEKILEIL
ncbi:MAG: macro domain-containing protein [Candidatus Lokiarchaeota archaeon]|jgi:O-acetyl-ADP-ribose deacetylase (regulator of RNase III)